MIKFAQERIPRGAGTRTYELSLVCDCGYQSATCKVGKLSIEDSIAERESYVMAVFKYDELYSQEFAVAGGYMPFDEWVESVVQRISRLYDAVFYLHPVIGSDILTDVNCPCCGCLLGKSWETKRISFDI